MPGTPSTKWSLPTRAGSDAINQTDEYTVLLTNALDPLLAPSDQGLLSARPVSTVGSPSGKAGRTYKATDTGQLFRDTGTGWEEITNHGVWRTLAEQPFYVVQNTPAGTRWFNTSSSEPGLSVASGGSYSPAPVKLDPAAYPVAGKTAKLRLHVNLFTGGAPGIAPVFGMYVVSALGGTTFITVTLGAVVPGSTATFSGLVTGGAGADAVSGAFDFPTAGQYLFGVNLPAPTAASSYMTGRMQLQISHV